ncbi:MAG: ABC transporter, partial [Deltaproteobacteria bacterium]|nr:ABC transporter [Deltaproteobacteria bacterium]
GGSIGVNLDFKYTFTPLLSTTAESGDLEVFSAQYFPPSQLSKNLKKNGKARVMAALITGRLESAFPDGPPPPEKGEKNPSPKGDGGRPAPHLKRAEKDVPVMVVGDADFMADPFAVKAIPFMGGQTLYQPLNDNLNFVLNGVEYLSGSQDLIRVRSRGTASRPFTTVLNLQRDAEQRFQAQEEQLRGKLQEVQTKLDQLQKQQQGKDVILSPEMVREVQSFRDEERRTRRELREVRQGLRQDIESLGNWLLLMNMLLMPLAVLGVGTAVYLRRTREGKRS